MIDILKKYDCFKKEKLEELILLDEQGLSNTNYLLKTSKKNYIIKVFGSLHVDRKFEFEVSKKAYKKGIGANPVLLDMDNSLMIYEFLDGFHKFKLKRDDIKSIALLLKKLHKIKVRSRKKDFVLCHHDLNPKNFIFLKKDIRLIDWEYASANDRYFDLASVAVEFKLNKKEERIFLGYYFKNNHLINIKKINFYKIKYVKICKKWFKLHASLCLMQRSS